MNNFLDISQYEIGNCIGEGPLAEVYRLKEKSSQKSLVIKIFKKPIDKEDLSLEETKQLTKDINFAYNLEYPAITKFYDLLPYSHKTLTSAIISEFYSARSLRNLIQLRNENPTTEHFNDTIKLITIYGIAKAMEYLHSKGIIHCNLKPENVLMDRHGRPCVTDYALSYFNHNLNNIKNIELSEVVHGTILCFPPEFYSKYQYTKEGDVYAFSMIVYEILANKKPFNGQETAKIIQKVKNGIRPKLDNSIPIAYQNLIKKCWNKDPNKRPTFGQIVKEIDENRGFISDTVVGSKFYLYTEEYNSLPKEKVEPFVFDKFEEDELLQEDVEEKKPRKKGKKKAKKDSEKDPKTKGKSSNTKTKSKSDKNTKEKSKDADSKSKDKNAKLTKAQSEGQKDKNDEEKNAKMKKAKSEEIASKKDDDTTSKSDKNKEKNKKLNKSKSEDLKTENSKLKEKSKKKKEKSKSKKSDKNSTNEEEELNQSSESTSEDTNEQKEAEDATTQNNKEENQTPLTTADDEKEEEEEENEEQFEKYIKEAEAEKRREEKFHQDAIDFIIKKKEEKEINSLLEEDKELTIFLERKYRDTILKRDTICKRCKQSKYFEDLYKESKHLYKESGYACYLASNQVHYKMFICYRKKALEMIELSVDNCCIDTIHDYIKFLEYYQKENPINYEKYGKYLKMAAFENFTDSTISYLKLIKQKKIQNNNFSEIAKLYDRLSSVQTNPEESNESYMNAAFYYKKAANKNHLDSMYRYAQMIEEGNIKDEPKEKAIKLYKKAAEKGHAGSLFKCAQMIEQDKNSTRYDLERANELYKKSALLNHPDAMFKYAQILEDICMLNSDRQKAIDLYQKAAYLNHPASMFRYAQILEDGVFVVQNRTKAVELYVKSANMNFPEAMYKYAKMLEDGFCVVCDKLKALEFYQKASELNHVESTFRLAQLVEEGKITVKNNLLALQLYKKAADSNKLDYIKHYAKLLRDGSLAPANLVEANKYDKIALELSN